MRRAILLMLAGIAGAVLAIAGYLVATSAAASHPVSLDGAMLERGGTARSDADLILVSSASGAIRAATGNPVGKALIASRAPGLDAPWTSALVGPRSASIWISNEGFSAHVETDLLRRFLLRALIPLIAPTLEVDADGKGVIIRASGLADASTERPEAWQLLVDAAPAPRDAQGDLFVLHSKNGPVRNLASGHEALTAVRFGKAVIDTTTWWLEPNAGPAISAPESFPADAWVSAWYVSAPRWLRSAGRVTAVDLRSVIDQSNQAALYGIESGKLLPRPRLVLGFATGPGADAANELIDSLPRVPDESTEHLMFGNAQVTRTRKLGLTIDRAWTGNAMFLAVDDKSMEARLMGTPVPGPWHGQPVSWCIRIRPDLLAPSIEKLAERKELKVLSRDLYNSIRSVSAFLGPLGNSSSGIWISESPAPGLLLRRTHIEARR